MMKNSILVSTGQIVDAPDGMVSYCDTMTTGGFNIDNAGALIENIFAEDPEFADAANFDFTVSSFFADLVKGDDGLVVGDLRWSPPSAIGDPNNGLPKHFSLSQNYPNPFNPSTLIKYQLPKTTHVKLIIYNVLGQEIIKLVDEDQKPGLYQVNWDGRSANGNRLSSGLYFFKIEAKEFVKTKKMILLK